MRVTRLANTLRYTLASGQDELVTLDQELEIVQDYLELESLRFEDRLSIDCIVTCGCTSRPDSGHAPADGRRERHQARNRRPAGGWRAEDPR